MLHEYPDRNFDDLGPKSIEALALDIRNRLRNGEEVFEVLSQGVPVGVIGYARESETLGRFHGICFTKSVHGSGIAHEAVRQVIERAFDQGAETIVAAIFADNTRVKRFLEKLGAQLCYTIWSDTPRQGKPVQWMLLQILREPGMRPIDFVRENI